MAKFKRRVSRKKKTFRRKGIRKRSRPSMKPRYDAAVAAKLTVVADVVTPNTSPG